jgi:putative nucleotidyltransferase with HDIG domain
LKVLRRTAAVLALASGGPALAVAVAGALGVGPVLLLVLGLMGALVACAGALWVARRVSRPVVASIEGALEIARGKFGIQVPVEGKDELSDLAHTFNFMSMQLAQYDTENKELIGRLEAGYVQTIIALANSIDSKDRYTRGHSQRVGDLAVEIGKELGLDGQALQDLRFGGILHDIGKIGAPEAILTKRDRLTDDEMAIMRKHPETGAQIVAPVSFLAGVMPAVKSHHERWDGKGYPEGLAGEAIPLIARIVTASDTWDACTSTRPYSKAMSSPEAIEVIRKLSGGQLDPKVAEACIRAVEKRSQKGIRSSEAA